MARLLDRFSTFNAKLFPTLWQRSCERIEANFVNVFSAISTMPDIVDIHILADYTGTVLTGQLPRTVQAQRFTGETDNTTDATWSFSVDSGALTATITDGALEITAIMATSVVTITSDYSSVEKSRTFIVYLDGGAVPSTGTSGGTSASDTIFASFNSTSHAAVSDELTVVVGASGTVNLSAPLSVYTAATAPTGTFEVYGKWQWYDSGGAVWTDLAAEVASNPDCTYGVGIGGLHNGALNVPDSKTGLTPTNSEKFRLMARNASGTRVMYLSGTASAVS